MPTEMYSWIISALTEELHIALLKLGGMICAFGDIAAVFLLLLVDRELTGRTPKKRMAALAVCLALSAVQLLPNDADQFFVVMLAVFAVPYIILIGTAVATAPRIVAHIKRMRTR